MLKDACGYFVSKDPDSTEDFMIDWTLFLGSETITESTWDGDGLTVSASGLSSDARRATALISGGVCGSCYRVRNRITTSGGRIQDQSFRVEMAEK